MEDAEMPYNPSGFDVPELVAAAEERLLGVKGVTGVGLGTDQTGGDALMVYAEDGGVAQRLPQTFRGMPVITVVTGIIDAQ